MYTCYIKLNSQYILIIFISSLLQLGHGWDTARRVLGCHHWRQHLGIYHSWVSVGLTAMASMAASGVVGQELQQGASSGFIKACHWAGFLYVEPNFLQSEASVSQSPSTDISDLCSWCTFDLTHKSSLVANTTDPTDFHTIFHYCGRNEGFQLLAMLAA